MLALQGVGWLTRKILSNATITVSIKHYKDEGGVEHVDIQQAVTGGITASPECKVLNWAWVKVDLNLFGPIIGRSRRVPIADVTDKYLNSGWSPDVSRDGAIETYAETDKEKSSYSWKSDVVSEFSPHGSRTPHVLT